MALDPFKSCLVNFCSKDLPETTVSAIPLKDDVQTTINPGKMEPKSQLTTPQNDNLKIQSITDSDGSTYMPIVTYASRNHNENR